MDSSEVRWASLDNNCKGRNSLKQVIGERKGIYYYVNEGYRTRVLEGSKQDFSVEFGCHGFDDFAVKIPTSSCLAITLLSESAFFILEETDEVLTTGDENGTREGLLNARVLLVDAESEYDAGAKVAMLRVTRQYRLRRETASAAAQWGFICGVYHLYASQELGEFA